MRVPSQLDELTRLPQDWDGYGSPSIHPHVIINTLAFLHSAGLQSTRPPALVATGRGTIQIEWHHRGREVDVDVQPDGRFYASLAGPEGEIELEGDVHEAIDPRLAEAIAYGS